MDSKAFQDLNALLVDLSDVQQEALLAALKRRLPVKAVDLIDTRFSVDPCCGHCGSKKIGGWSSHAGLKRYCCKDCEKTFNVRWTQPQEGGQALRYLARHGLRWRHPFLSTAKGVKAKVVKGIVQADEMLVSDGRAAYGQFADRVGLPAHRAGRQ